MLKKLLIVLVALGIVGGLGFTGLAWRPAIAPITPPAPGSFSPELVAKGEVLARAGYCAECHTAKGGQSVRRRLLHGDSIRRDLLHEHHARSEDRHRRLVGDGVCSRDARRRRPRRVAPFSRIPLRPLHQGFGRGRESDLCVLDDPAAGRSDAAGEHNSLPAQYSRLPGRLENSVLQTGPVSSRSPARTTNGIAALTSPSG